MSQSGEKLAQDYNLIWCILMALRATYFLSVIYGDPVGTQENIWKEKISKAKSRCGWFPQHKIYQLNDIL